LNLSKNRDEVYPVYLTTGTVAKYCGVSKVTVLRWIEKGNLVAFKLPGGQNRIHRDDFFAFANKHGIPLKRE
jgi:two-component system response regulator VicR